jgi:hypothetical protein
MQQGFKIIKFPIQPPARNLKLTKTQKEDELSKKVISEKFETKT